MRHVTSPVLRRLRDEPLAVPDTARQHLAGCARCQAASAAIAADAALAEAALAPGLNPDRGPDRETGMSASPAPRLDPDVDPRLDPGLDADLDRAWARLQGRLHDPSARTARSARSAVRDPWALPRRLGGVSLRTGTVAAVGALAVGVAAAATLTTVYAPTRVAPVPVAPGDLRAIAAISGIGADDLGSLPPSGTRQLPFGTLSWTTDGPAQSLPSAAGPAVSAASLAQAFAITGLSYAPPRLPAGVGPMTRVIAAPKVTATIRFSTAAGAPVGGSTLVVTGGPALLVQYGSVGSTGAGSSGAGSSGASDKAGPGTFAIALMRRPTATSTGATASQLEAFLLAQPGLPAAVRQDIKMLGTTALPVPIPAGTPVQHVTIGGAPGLLVADPSGAAAGVIWESRSGVIRGVAGVTDQKDVLDVARQLG